MNKKIEFLDTTLRDGAQAVGISYSEHDKEEIFKLLDNFGIDLIEGGEPGFNPKDEEFFAAVKSPKLTAFGATRRRDTAVLNDDSVKKLVHAGTGTVCVFGKCSLSQARRILGVSDEENLKMIKDTVSCLKAAGKRVIFDAEHFFDGYKENREYAVNALSAARGAGADTLVLCDTNGGNSPTDIYQITSKIVTSISGVKIGIHTHNDRGTAVASSVMAVKAGATHVQGTFLGFGERCGNANLSTVIATLALKESYATGCKLADMTRVAHGIAEISNIVLDASMPYVGPAAFTHKAGTHSDAVIKEPSSFEHIKPALVGNKRNFLLSEMAGRAAVAKNLENVFPALDKNNPKTREILDEVKSLERDGYKFEGADGSFVLLAKRRLGSFKPSFTLESYNVKTSMPSGENTAEVVLNVDGTTGIAAESGNGPVNALDKALRRALAQSYPEIDEVSLVDYKVRVLDSSSATGATVRVFITSRDKETAWTTVGVSSDIIEASFNALVDSLEYKLNGKS